MISTGVQSSGLVTGNQDDLLRRYTILALAEFSVGIGADPPITSGACIDCHGGLDQDPKHNCKPRNLSYCT